MYGNSCGIPPRSWQWEWAKTILVVYHGHYPPEAPNSHGGFRYFDYRFKPYCTDAQWAAFLRGDEEAFWQSES